MCFFNRVYLFTSFYKGTYTETIGLKVIREDVAQFISKRDGYAAYPEDIILTNGGADGIRVRNTVGTTENIIARSCQVSLHSLL